MIHETKEKCKGLAGFYPPKPPIIIPEKIFHFLLEFNISMVGKWIYEEYSHDF